MNKIVVALCVTFLCFTAFGQNEITAKQSSNKMASKEHNYTSFAAPLKKEVNKELLNYTSDKFRNHPELGINPYNTQCEDCFEVIEERTATTRKFLKKETNGTIFYNQAGANNINYQDASGNWRAIDPRMSPSSEFPNVYSANNQPSPTKIDLTKKEVSINNGDNILSYNRNLKLYYKTDAETKLVAAANWSEATVGFDGVYVKNIFPGIDLEVYAINGALKTNYIVKNKVNYQEGYLLIEDEMKLPAGTSFSTKQATKNELGYQGLLTITNQSSDISLYEIGEVIGYDNSNHRQNPSKSFSYSISGNNLSIVIPVNWMNTQGLVYPLTIDPLVTSTGTFLMGSMTGSGGNGSGTWVAASACPYTLVVPTPANCTITDILWSFTYLAQNGAIKDDGAVDFLYNACRSPANALFFWTCQDGSAGPCMGINISMFTDFAACIPAPQCTPYNMSFKMRFYDAYGFACSNTYIAANSNWVMTVQGQTVNFTNTSTPFTLSANTVCFGQNISASTGTQYGVPVHSVNWSYNSSGVPSVGSGNNTTLTFPSAGTYTVYCIVTDGCGQTVSSNQVVTVNPLPTLTLTPSANPICAGQSSILTASGANTYTWSANAGGGTGTTATVTPPTGTTVYSVTATSVASCVNTGTVSVTVNPLPTVTAVAAPTTVCSGQSSLLTGSGAITYTWSANAGSVQTDTTSVFPVIADTYTVTGTDINACTNTATVTVNITPSPTVVTSVTTATICAGKTDTISVSGAATYTWSANAGSATTSTVSVNPATTTVYTVTGNNGGGCTSTQTVTVNVTPLPSLTVTASPNSICTAQSSTLTVNGATTYTWSANAGSVNTTTVSVSPGSTDTYTVSATQSGCSDSTTITVNVVAPPTVSVTATQTIICSGGNTILTGSGATNYTWMPGASSTNPLTVSPGVTTTYSLIGSNGACLDSTTIVINVNPTPTVIVNNPAPICSGATSTLTASGATTFTWMPGSVVSNTISVSPGSTQTYTVTGDSLTCQSTQTVTVNVTATPTVIVICPTPTVCSGQSIPIIAGGATTYTWSANAGGGTTNPVIVTPTTNPTIFSCTGANGNCIGTGTISIGVVTTPTVTSVSPPAICQGQTDTLTATYAPGTSTLSWSPGGSTNDTVFVSPNSTTSYTVNADNGGCKDSAIVSVTVNPIPTLTLSTNPTQTICYGNNVSGITFSTSAGAMVGWTNTNIAIGLAANGTTNIPGYAAPNVVTQQVGVITVVPMDMTTSCIGAPQTFTITIKPSPTVTAVSPPAICQGQTATLTATYAPVTSTLSWSPGGSANDTVFVSPNSTTSYTVIADINGCKDSAIVSVTVNPTPTLTLSAVTTQTVCYGNNVIGITFATGGGATVGWTNTNVGIGIAASGNGNIPGYAASNVAAQQVGIITATPTSTASCVGASQTFTITINPSPTISGTPTIDSAFCGMPVGDIKNLIITGGTPGYTYQWNIGGVPYSGATKDSLINVPAGSYNLDVTDALGCKANSGSIIIGGTPAVAAAFTASTYHGTAPLPVTFTNGSTGAVNYNWSFGNGGSSGAPNPTYTYQQGGTYQVILTASNGNCSDTAMRTITIDQPIIVTVPNIFSPNGDGINEEFSIIASGVTDLNCEIFNRWGQKVFTLSSPTGKWDGKLDNGNTATEGTYFYMLTAKSYDGKQHNSQGSITLVR